MPQDPLPVAVIGVGGVGRWTLQALLASESARVVGVADKDPRIAERAGTEFKVPSYGDNRSLLAEARPTAVFLAVPPMAAPDLLAACAERGIHVWKEMPLARNLAEGLAFVTRMEAAGLKLAVGTQRRFAVGYRRAWELRRRLGRVFLGRAHYLFNWGPNLTWRGDRASAGGGALLELGYHAVDLMVWMLGLPEEAYGISARGNRPGDVGPDGADLPLYDTDDTAAVILRYADGGMSTVVTTRSSGPVSEELSLHGRGGSVTATGESCLMRDPEGTVLDRVAGDEAPLAVFRRQAEAFVAAVRDGAKRYDCSARENLLDLAVVEAAYLSDRTGQAENPRSLLKNHALAVEDCLTLRPIEAPDEEELPAEAPPAAAPPSS